MSLTGKLVLGFLFALVLQVVQMVVSGQVATSMQRTSEKVAGVLHANIAVRHSLDIVREVRQRIAGDVQGDDDVPVDVYAVYFDELERKASSLVAVAGQHAPNEVARFRGSMQAARKILADLGEGKRLGNDVRTSDALEFLDDALADVGEYLNQSQVVFGEVGERGIEEERGMRELPWRAGLAITLCGVLIMAAFVAWFSRQLVIPIERAWAQLELRVEERTSELASTVGQLETEIAERRRAEQQKEELHQQLVDASRQAGMAELANGVLHNVGNVLNSVNVSSSMLLDRLRNSRVEGLGKAVELMRAHDHELADFLTASERGRQLPVYLAQLARHLEGERDQLLDETRMLTESVTHMKEIVHRQQAYAQVSGTTSALRPIELLDDVLRMHATSFREHEIVIERRVGFDDECELDRSRVMQILMNLVNNAKQAVREVRDGDGRVVIAVEERGERLRWSVADNGVGIAADDLARVFAHGFTTKSDGHGFGLHHSANAATEMGGRLWAESDGKGHGATFVLELPLVQPTVEAA